MNSLSKYKGRWALITGAGRGLGAEFARQCAAAKLNVLLVDVNAEDLEVLSKRYRQDFGVDVISCVCDLSKDNCLDIVTQYSASLDVTVLINNAGVASIKPFLKQTTQELMTQLHVNARAVLGLTHYYALLMAERGEGAIIIVSSGAAELPSAFNASYSASKAYDLKLAESLWYELKPLGIDVLGFMPVATLTPAILAQGYESSRKLMSVEESVTAAFNALGKTPSWVPGRVNRYVHYFLLKCVSRNLRIRIVSQQIKAMFAVKV